MWWIFTHNPWAFIIFNEHFWINSNYARFSFVGCLAFFTAPRFVNVFDRFGLYIYPVANNAGRDRKLKPNAVSLLPNLQKNEEALNSLIHFNTKYQTIVKNEQPKLEMVKKNGNIFLFRWLCKLLQFYIHCCSFFFQLFISIIVVVIVYLKAMSGNYYKISDHSRVMQILME